MKIEINLNSLKQLRDTLREAGAPEILSDSQRRGGLSSIKTGKDIPHIPHSAGFAKRVRSPKRARPAKASEPSWKITVEKDKSLEDEVNHNKGKEANT